MKSLYLLCSMLLLLSAANAQSKVFVRGYNPMNIYTNQELSGYIQESWRGQSDSVYLEIMDEQFRPLADVPIKANPMYFRFMWAARYGNVVALVYTVYEVGVFTMFVTTDGSRPVQTYKEPLPKRDNTPPHDDQEILAMPGVGFACYYGEKLAYKVKFFDTTGVEKTSCYLPFKPHSVKLLSYGHKVYFQAEELVTHYDLDKGMFMEETKLDGLKVLNFALDPLTGKPYISGAVLHPDRKGKRLAAGIYTGFFTMDFDSSWHAKYTSWGKDTVVPISPKVGVRDLKGNTVFAGGQLEGNKFMDPFVMAVDSSGQIVYRTSFPTEHYLSGMNPSLRNGHQGFHQVIANGKEYLLVTDLKNHYVYSFEERKVIKTIGYKEIYYSLAGNGQIVIVEHNRKERSVKCTLRPFEDILAVKQD